MKKATLFFIIAVFSTTGFKALAQKATSEPIGVVSGPQAKWNTLVVDLGEVKFMTSTDAVFHLTNSGNQPLIITMARASCGCTNLRYSQEPILPGASVPLQVTFNGSGMGNVRKTLTVQTNASNETTILAFTANVVAEPKVSATSQGN